MSIRILIVDDHYVARFGLKRIVSLDPDMTVVGETASGSEAVALYQRFHPDVVLMDLRMKGFDGFDAIVTIHQRDETARILVVSSYDTEADVQRARSAGALGFVMKEMDRHDILDAIRSVAAGHVWMPASLASRLAAESNPKLTATELRLLRLTAEGLTSKEIAERTQLAVNTVNIYCSRINLKLGVRSRAEAIFEARRCGWLQDKS